jgi:hypothetical protein
LTSPSHKKIKLVIYPGEGRRGDGTTIGTIYVVGGHGEKYPIAGGPPPGKGHKDRGGHVKGRTPEGTYVLDGPEHHVTRNWPGSIIPWGAKLRESGGVVQYEVKGKWYNATGHDGAVVGATRLFLHRDGRHATDKEIEAAVRAELLNGPDGALMPVYKKNDFGKWSWNLKRHGARSAFYIHTTPENEAQQEASTPAKPVPVVLEQSHGCVHVRPADRDDMIKKGYLKPGVEVEIKPYADIGPPK